MAASTDNMKWLWTSANQGIDHGERSPAILSVTFIANLFNSRPIFLHSRFRIRPKHVSHSCLFLCTSLSYMDSWSWTPLTIPPRHYPNPSEAGTSPGLACTSPPCTLSELTRYPNQMRIDPSTGTNRSRSLTPFSPLCSHSCYRPWSCGVPSALWPALCCTSHKFYPGHHWQTYRPDCCCR